MRQGHGKRLIGQLWDRKEEALRVMARSSDALPYAVVAAAALALCAPP